MTEPATHRRMTTRTLAAAMAAGMTPADLARLQEQLAQLRGGR